ncbi:MAG: AsnC family transcriptional regulator [Aeromicrobium sp.]|nr:AsnC family transcriptional regulator [Aeromicrobium sp.]
MTSMATDDGTPRPRAVLRSDPLEGVLEPLERSLIELLQVDGRTSFAEMARQTGVTEKTVRRKVNRLIELSAIQVSAVTDPELLGYTALGLVCIRLDGTRATAELSDTLAELPEVDYVTSTTGRFPIQAEVVCRDAVELQRVIDENIRPLAGVADVEVLPYLRLHYQQARFTNVLASDKPAGVRPLRLDETDRQVIALLATDGRIAFADIATELGVSETMVRQRYQKLVESNAVKVMCLVNPLRLGFRAAGWMVLKIAPSTRTTDVAEALTKLPAITYVALTAGRFDILAELVAADDEGMIAALDLGVRAIPGIADLELWMYLDLRYKPLYPPPR